MGRGDDPVCSACPGHLRHGSSGLYAVGAVVYTGKDMAVYIRRTNPSLQRFRLPVCLFWRRSTIQICIIS